MNACSLKLAMIRASVPPSSSSLTLATREASLAVPPLNFSARALLQSQVLSYSPSFGKAGDTLSIRFNLSEALSPDHDIFVFMEGDNALETKVERRSPPIEVLSSIPPPRDPQTQKPLPIRLDIVHKTTQRAVHSLSVGKFSYVHNSDPKINPEERVKVEEVDVEPPRRPTKRRSIDDDDWVPHSKSPRKSRRASRSSRRAPPSKARVHSLQRQATSKPAPPPVAIYHEPLPRRRGDTKLKFDFGWQDLQHEWTEEEVVAGRRLVRFQRVVVGCDLHVSATAVRQDQWNLKDDEKMDAKTISCIYNPMSDSCSLTSTEAILLMEYLADVPEVDCEVPFSVEHKNRIRRNLEVFKPTTIHRAATSNPEEFFNTIMEFPEPKPRGIRKDVKVFEWSGLGGMLDKVIGKLPFLQSGSTPGSTPPMSPVSRCSSLELSKLDMEGITPSIPSPDSQYSTPSLNSPAELLHSLRLSDCSPIIGTPELQYPPSPLDAEERRFLVDLGFLVDQRDQRSASLQPLLFPHTLDSPGASSSSTGTLSEEDSAVISEMEQYLFLDFGHSVPMQSCP